MPDELLTYLELSPEMVPSLEAPARKSLLSHLLRWEYFDTARRCLQQLLVTHSHLVSLYDGLARAYLGLDRPAEALEVIRRRHALKTSSSSRALEARVHLAGNDIASAQAISDELVEEHPELMLSWSLLAEMCTAAGDWEGAEAAWQRREAMRPETAATAHGLACLWQARGDPHKALLWARTALSRYERDERNPDLRLLRLLESLYTATGQDAQADATAARMTVRRERELEELRERLGLPGQPRTGEGDATPATSPGAPRGETTREAGTDTIVGAVDMTPEEKQRLNSTLHEHFEHEAFRPGQADVVAAILRGESVLAVMPTGAGKSLCYQLASLLLPGTTLVISPLIALMKDQIDGLPPNVAEQATTLNSTLEFDELDRRMARAAAGGYKMLYAAPERLRQRPFLHALERAGVSLLVIDEAHCVSLWGHDFRPDYLFIKKAWQELGRPPILAMTATATPRVRDDIQEALGGLRLVLTDIYRPNLRLEAFRLANNEKKMAALLAHCREIEGSGIVYANSRKRCEELAALLRDRGIDAIHYHAGIDDRAATQDRFMQGQARIVVATIAFGMGVDKSDVRFIIHFNPPKTLESYYQEAGRAGRDGLPARCILYHSAHDKGNLTSWTRQDALHVEFLRQTYPAIQRRLGSRGIGLVATADLERDLGADTTRLRVAVHFLETAGLLWRGFDLPRTAMLTLSHAPDGSDPDFARFVSAARLSPGQTATRSPIELAFSTEMDPRTVESQFLAWQDAGLMQYRGIARDMLLALPEPPPESRERVNAMLAEFRAGQDGRIAEIMAYATTRSCRHGQISAYFGGRRIERCEACDNCLGLSKAMAQPPAPIGQLKDPAPIILMAMTRLPNRMGVPGLSKLLNGSVSCTARARRSPDYGALRGMSQSAIQGQIRMLVDQGELEYYEKDEYRLVRLTGRGRISLRAGKIDRQSGEQVPSRSQQPENDGESTGGDAALFERLRAWRLEVAREMGRPAFAVFYDSELKQIASVRPSTVDELEAIDGIGPSRLKRYGPGALALLNSDPAHQTQPSATTSGRQGSGGQRLSGPGKPNEPIELDNALYERLSTWRAEEAKETGLPPFFVFPNAVLERIAAVRPLTLEEFIEIKGIGPAKRDKYGDAVLEIVKSGGAADDGAPGSEGTSP